MKKTLIKSLDSITLNHGDTLAWEFVESFDNPSVVTVQLYKIENEVKALTTQEKIKRMFNELGFGNLFVNQYSEEIYSIYFNFAFVESVDKYLKTFEIIKRYFPLAKIRNSGHNLEVLFKDE